MNKLTNSISISQNLGFSDLDDCAAAETNGGGLTVSDTVSSYVNWSEVKTFDLEVGDTVCFDELGFDPSYFYAYRKTFGKDTRREIYRLRDDETGATEDLVVDVTEYGEGVFGGIKNFMGTDKENIFDSVERIS